MVNWSFASWLVNEIPNYPTITERELKACQSAFRLKPFLCKVTITNIQYFPSWTKSDIHPCILSQISVRSHCDCCLKWQGVSDWNNKRQTRNKPTKTTAWSFISWCLLLVSAHHNLDRLICLSNTCFHLDKLVHHISPDNIGSDNIIKYTVVK